MKLVNITVARRIPASAERIFETWMNPNGPGGPWFGAERVIINPQVGLFYLAVKHEGRTWPHYGRFIEIDRPRRVQYTWVSEATKGVESVVTVTLEARADETEVTLRHSGVPDDELGASAQGWLDLDSVYARTGSGGPPRSFFIRLGRATASRSRRGALK
jgi:uncharacterized protein YndB with AHSA1/START domain